MWRRWRAEREELWEVMAGCLKPEAIAAVHTATVGLGEVHSCAEQILEGKVSGRVVVDVNK